MPSTRLRRTLKRFYYRFMRIRGTPRQIALGFALGLFVGMTPFLGFHTVLAVMLAALFGWSKISAGIAVFVTNPFTAPFIYPLTYRLGVGITGLSDPDQWSRIFEPGGVMFLVKESPLILVDLLVGGIIVGLPLAVVFHYIVYDVVSRARRRLEIRKARRLAKKAAIRKRNGSPRKPKGPRKTGKEAGGQPKSSATPGHRLRPNSNGDGRTGQDKKIKSNNMMTVGTNAPSSMPMGATSSLK